jgi:hypothetical protein
MSKLTLNLLSLLAASCLLTACGGGDDGVDVAAEPQQMTRHSSVADITATTYALASSTQGTQSTQ